MFKYLLSEIWKRLKEKNLNLSQFAWLFCVGVFYVWFVDFDRYWATRYALTENKDSGELFGYATADKGRWRGFELREKDGVHRVFFMPHWADEMQWWDYDELFNAGCLADVDYVEVHYFTGVRRVVFRVVIRGCSSAGEFFSSSSQQVWNWYVTRRDAWRWWVVGYPIFAFSMMMLDIVLLSVRRQRQAGPG